MKEYLRTALTVIAVIGIVTTLCLMVVVTGGIMESPPTTHEMRPQAVPDSSGAWFEFTDTLVIMHRLDGSRDTLDRWSVDSLSHNVFRLRVYSR